MNQKDVHELTEKFQQQGTEELKKILSSRAEDYREEAFEAARIVLEQREAGAPDPIQLKADQAPKQKKNSIMRRYADAYITARAINGFGSLIKLFGIIIGILLALVLAVGALQFESPIFVLAGILLALAVALPIYVLGVVVAALAQIIKSIADTAVHSSPFLDDKERASVMAL